MTQEEKHGRREGAQEGQRASRRQKDGSHSTGRSRKQSKASVKEGLRKQGPDGAPMQSDRRSSPLERETERWGTRRGRWRGGVQWQGEGCTLKRGARRSGRGQVGIQADLRDTERETGPNGGGWAGESPVQETEGQQRESRQRA